MKCRRPVRARLCKADLVSLAVGEFPELQGVMGREYARNDGEADAVAKAIEEHYLPKGSEDAVADTRVGVALAIADRLDTLVGFFAIGQKPSGGGDPFGLRRAALGLLRTLMHHRFHLSARGRRGPRVRAVHARVAEDGRRDRAGTERLRSRTARGAARAAIPDGCGARVPGRRP